jgi:hypothetical protein
MLEDTGQFGRGQNEVRELIKTDGSTPFEMFGFLSQSDQKASPIGVFHIGKSLEKTGSGFCKIPPLNVSR